MMELRKATRAQTKMRISLSGISGSGKTYSALLLAKGLVDSYDKVAIIDTETGRADVYADLGSYNVLPLSNPFSPERFIEAINAVEADPNIEAIIIDSCSSEWQDAGGILEINENLANTKYKGNSWGAWNETTPRHNTFIQAIKNSRCHIICTLMAKEATAQVDGRIKKLGDKEIQREGFRRDMIIAFAIDHETHHCMTLKDNTFTFEKVDPFIMTDATGKKIKAWAESGKKVEADGGKPVEDNREKITSAFLLGQETPEVGKTEPKDDFVPINKRKKTDDEPAEPKEETDFGICEEHDVPWKQFSSKTSGKKWLSHMNGKDSSGKPMWHNKPSDATLKAMAETKAKLQAPDGEEQPEEIPF